MKKFTLLIIFLIGANCLTNINIKAEKLSLFKPFEKLNEMAQQAGVGKTLIFTPLMDESELNSNYRKLSLKYHPDKCKEEKKVLCEKQFKQLTDAKDNALKALGTLKNPTPEIQFILKDGTYVWGTIPKEISIPPFHWGLIKRKNKDPQAGKLVCFGPLNYIDKGKRVKIRNGRAEEDCFKAQADESKYGCRTQEAMVAYNNGFNCKDNCWKKADCSFPRD